MLSKGKKICYFCPNCNSINIYQLSMYGQNSGSCNDCNNWWPWRSRIKRKLINGK